MRALGPQKIEETGKSGNTGNIDNIAFINCNFKNNTVIIAIMIIVIVMIVRPIQARERRSDAELLKCFSSGSRGVLDCFYQGSAAALKRFDSFPGMS